MATKNKVPLSENFEELVARRAGRADDDRGLDFDTIIVGSGYGGAIAAAELSGRLKGGGTVCVLERGQAYEPGDFPSTLAELPTHVRANGGRGVDIWGNREGLFDLRLGMDISTIVANGLGGRSLINAGVMEIPEREVFAAGWPDAIKNDKKLYEYFEDAAELLGAVQGEKPNTILDHRAGVPKKYEALKRLAHSTPEHPAVFREAKVTVAMQDGPNQADLTLDACKRCGDCATGCNHNAKNSLDRNLLVQARRRGAEIFTGAAVLRVRPVPYKKRRNRSAWKRLGARRHLYQRETQIVAKAPDHIALPPRDPRRRDHWVDRNPVAFGKRRSPVLQVLGPRLLGERRHDGGWIRAKRQSKRHRR